MPVTTNAIMVGTRGAIGKQVVFRKVGDKTIVSAYPQFNNRKLSEKQLMMNGLMIEANGYAKQIIADEQLRNAAQVRLNVQRNKLYTTLIKEFFQNAKAKEAEEGKIKE